MQRCLYIVLVVLLIAGCGGGKSLAVVVVYVSVDQVHAESVLQAFEVHTGIQVEAVYDSEASKTTGLVNRLYAERSQPQADVFWSSEIAQTLVISRQGVLATYDSPTAADIPEIFRDPDNYWTGMGLRARVFIVNTALVPEEAYPTSIFDLLDVRWQPGDAGIANPLFGTASTHAAALYAAMGATEARGFFQALADHEVRLVNGNSVVRDMVASGDLLWGLTDTDDALVAIERGAPVGIVFPDQDGLGTLMIPNTVALVAGAPHQEQGQMLIDFLLSVEVETMLIDTGFLFTSVRSENQDSALVSMNVSWADVAAQFTQSQADLEAIFLN